MAVQMSANRPKQKGSITEMTNLSKCLIMADLGLIILGFNGHGAGMIIPINPQIPNEFSALSVDL